jgi:hypothetical protein
MRAHFIWPSSGLNMITGSHQRASRPVFWVTATPEEMADKITPLWSPEQVLAFQELSPTMIEDSYLLDGRYSFFVPAWIPDDGSDPPALDIRVRPYSGMWNGRRPWIAIGPPTPGGFNEPEGIEITELIELDQLRFTLLNGYHLARGKVA